MTRNRVPGKTMVALPWLILTFIAEIFTPSVTTPHLPNSAHHTCRELKEIYLPADWLIKMDVAFKAIQGGSSNFQEADGLRGYPFDGFSVFLPIPSSYFRFFKGG